MMYQWVCKYYGKIIDNPVKIASKKNKEYQDCIWLCWLQGIEKAPEIVRLCYESVLRYSNGRKVVLLNKQNICKYILLPEYIINKHQKGIIGHAMFCDILRMALLEKYGGIWIDATVLLTAPLEKAISDMPIFCFSNPRIARMLLKSSSWFIACHAGNEIIAKTKNALYLFWKERNKQPDYYLVHYLLTRAVESNTDTRKMWKEMPYFNNDNCHLLQYELSNEFCLQRWNYIKKISDVHKLTYITCSDSESYYAKLIKKEIS